LSSILEKTTSVINTYSLNFISLEQPPNGVRYLRVGGRGFCLGAEKTQSQKNA